VRVVLDDEGAVASAIGAGTGEDTEVAVLVRDGEIVARAEGLGAAYAVATAGSAREQR
jgi:hypothetical protein